MTCIVGLVDQHSHDVYIGADSAAMGELDISIRADPKVFANQDFLFGFTSSFRMGQILRYNFYPTFPDPNQDLFEYMVTVFIEQVRECLRRFGFASVSDNVETGGFFLVGHAGRLFEIESDYQVAEVLCGYDSLGCGREYALGSLYSTKGNKNPRDRVKLALEAAEAHSAGVLRPFHIMRLQS